MPTPHIDPSAIAMLIKLLKKPRTVEELAEKLGVTTRSVYRYLTLVSKDGYIIAASLERPTKYRCLKK